MLSRVRAFLNPVPAQTPDLSNPIVLLKSSGLFDPISLHEDAPVTLALRDSDLYQAFLRSNTGDIHKWHHYFNAYRLS